MLEHVLRHVLLIDDFASARAIWDQSINHTAPVRLVSRDDLLCARVIVPSELEIMRIKWLVDHRRIAAARPRAQQGCRDIPWSRPHGDNTLRQFTYPRTNISHYNTPVRSSRKAPNCYGN